MELISSLNRSWDIWTIMASKTMAVCEEIRTIQMFRHQPLLITRCITHYTLYPSCLMLYIDFWHMTLPVWLCAMDASLKCRRLDPSSIRSVEGDAEWKLYNAGVMRAHFLKYLGMPHGYLQIQKGPLDGWGWSSSSNFKHVFPPLTN